jgi:hypothetical protein
MAAHTCEQKRTRHLRTISPHKVLYAIAVTTSLLPYVWVAGIVWLAIRAREYLGYWPTPSHPDPQFIPFDHHQELLWQIFWLLGWSLVVVPMLYFSSRWLLKNRMPRLPLYTYACGWLLIMAMIFVPNINFVSWFLD